MNGHLAAGGERAADVRIDEAVEERYEHEDSALVGDGQPRRRYLITTQRNTILVLTFTYFST